MMPSSKGRPALGGVADGRRHAGIGHRHHHVGIDRRFAGELGPDAAPGLVDTDPFGDAVGPREVDVFEDAEALRGGAERLDALHPCVGDDDHLAGLDVAHVAGADDVESHGLRCQNHRAVELPQHQRAHAVGVAHADQRILGQRHQRIGAAHPAQRLDHALHQAPALADGDQVDDDLGVGGGLEDAAARDESVAEHARVGEVAVVRDAKPADGEVGEERLDVAHFGGALRGIAVVADGRPPRERVDHLARGKYIADQPERPVRMKERAVGADDAGRFLAPVLQRVQAERGMGGCVGVPEDAEDPALLPQFVVVGCVRVGLRAPPGSRHHSTFSLSPSSWLRSRSL